MTLHRCGVPNYRAEVPAVCILPPRHISTHYDGMSEWGAR